MYKRALGRLLDATLRLDTVVGRVYPDDFNPLYYTGGLSNLFLTILVLTGIFLFFYYVPSFDDAYSSVQFASITCATPESLIPSSARVSGS